MANYIYARVSTDHQDYPQQRNTINRYFRNNGISLDSIKSEVVEKITGTKDHTERKFAHLFAKCKRGDIIYFSELSRIGRSMSDLNNIVHQACKRGIILMQCKDGMRIEDETIGGKALLFALSLAAEIEVANLHQRTQSGVDVATREIKENGKRMTRSGSIQDHWGNAKGTDETKRIMAIAREAAILQKQNAVMEWRDKSDAVAFARRKRAEGRTMQQIVDEIGIMFDDYAQRHPGEPNIYATPNGYKPMKGTISKWLRESNLLLVG